MVRGTGEILSVQVGDGYLGRVVDAMGTPIDGKGPIEGATERRPLELQAAGVMDRQEVGEPLMTGLKAIDAMTPIGRGQRQLIIGDRDRQDRHRRRHHTQPARQLGERRPEQAGAVHHRRGRPEELHGGRGARDPQQGRRDGLPVIVNSPASDWPASKYIAPLRRLGDRPTLDVPGPPRANRLRQAPSRPRPTRPCRCCCAARRAFAGLLQRRLLPAQPPAGALREALGRNGRRVDDRPADRRDQGERRVGLHPDQRDLDHRRGESSCSPTCSTPTSVLPWTSASRSRASVAPPRPRR